MPIYYDTLRRAQGCSEHRLFFPSPVKLLIKIVLPPLTGGIIFIHVVRAHETRLQ